MRTAGREFERALVIAAKTLLRNARTLALSNPTPLVADGLAKAGLRTTLEHVADTAICDRHIAPPAGITGIGLGQAAHDGEARLIGFQRFR
jgi:hypothetical protein